jgi:hypothetical protein
MNPFVAVLLWLGGTVVVILLFHFVMRAKRGRE